MFTALVQDTDDKECGKLIMKLQRGLGARALELQFFLFLYSNLRKNAPYGQEARLRICSSDGDQLV